MVINYIHYEHKLNAVFSRNKLPRIKDKVYIIKLVDKINKGEHWVSLSIDKNTVINFDSFRTEYIPQGVLNKFRNISVYLYSQYTHNIHDIFRI